MKTKISRIGKKSLSFVIVMMMVVSMMLVGMVSASAATISGGTVFYLDPGGDNLWAKDSARFAMYLCNGSSDATWVDMVAVSGTSYYSATVPAGQSHANVIFCRMNPGTTANNWNNKWNQTSDLTYDRTKNLYTITAWDNVGTWSTYSGGGGTDTPTDTTYYIGGRFRVRTSAGSAYTYTYDSGDWLSDSKKIALTDDDGDGIFTLNTYCTLTELSQNIGSSTYTGIPYFYILSSDTKKTYSTTANTALSLNDATNNITLTEKSGNNPGTYLYFNDSDSSDTVTLNFNPETKAFYYTFDNSTSVEDGDYTIFGTSEYGSFKFKGSGNTTEGTANANDTVTVTVTPDAGYICTGITATGVTDITIVNSNKYTFTMPAQNVTVSATFDVAPPEKITKITGTDALWIDANPNGTVDTTLIKWNNYSGSSKKETDLYTFYVPKNVDLSNATIYNGFSTEKEIGDITIPANGCATGSLTIGDYYSFNGKYVQVMQGSTNAMFLYTTLDGNDYPLPTEKEKGADSTGTITKSSVEADGGLCITMTDDNDNAVFSDPMKLSSVKGRGNSSWEASHTFFGKYAFNMKLKKAVNLFGMDSKESDGAKSWCLLANNADESNLRNALTYQLANELGLDYAPEFRFVDIYDNNVYMGSYLVTEKVDVGKDKLIKGEAFDDINEEPLADGEKIYENEDGWKLVGNGPGNAGSYRYVDIYKGTSVTTQPPYNERGTYLLEFEITDRTNSEASWFVSNEGQNVVVKSPEFATKEQVEFIRDKFNAMETAIYNNADVDTLSQYMDVESFATMYLIQELSGNLDAASTSYYIIYDCNVGRFVATPVWDYDMAYGQHANDTFKYAVGNNAIQLSNPSAWIAKYKKIDKSEHNSPNKYSIQSQLASQNASFKSVIRYVWNNTFYPTIKKYYGENSQLDQWKSQISASMAMNETRWGFLSAEPLFSWRLADTGDNLDDTVTYLETTWTKKRVEFLNDEFAKSEYPDTYTPATLATPTVKAYASDGTTELTGSVEAESTYIIKATTTDSDVTFVLYNNGKEVTSNKTGEFEITAVVGTYSYTVKTTSGDVTSSASDVVSVTVSSGSDIVASDWSVVGSFNNWDATRNPMSGTGPYTASIYLPANSTGYTFKIKDNTVTDNAHYGKYQSKIDDTGSLTLNNTSSSSGGSNGYITLKTTGGVYTFTWNGTSLQVSVSKSDDYNLTSTITVPESVGVGDTFDVTVNAIPSASFPTAKYYRYTIAVDGTKIANGVELSSSTYTCKTSISADATVTYYVEAYDENRVLLGLSATGEQTIGAIISDFTVDIKSSDYEIAVNDSITLTATVTPAGYAKSYEFFKSTDGETFVSMGTASTSNTLTVSFTEKGVYYFKAAVVNKYDTTVTEESYVIEVHVYDQIGPHTVEIYFKSASSFVYKPTLTYNGVAYAMTKDFEPVYEDGELVVQPYIGDAYSGSLKFYWYKAVVTLDSSVDNTLTFTTGRTQLNASFTGKFHGDRYFMAVDNLMNDTVALDITTAAEYIRNYYHSPLHMTSLGADDDSNLGFTNINGETYRMGDLLSESVDANDNLVTTSSFSIKSATTMQKVAAGLTEVSDLQASLLDVNLDGVIDVKDATLMQKALISA
ncbi:MAG: CotH kinase family protein [Ruminococcus sp.]|nr:CotH kinase family protein [Ruminococcus sp.]